MARDEPSVVVEVRVELKSGIFDAEAENIQKALGLLGVPEFREVSTARVYVLRFDGLSPERAEAQARRAVDRLLANPVIHRVTMSRPSR